MATIYSVKNLKTNRSYGLFESRELAEDFALRHNEEDSLQIVERSLFTWVDKKAPITHQKAHLFVIEGYNFTPLHEEEMFLYERKIKLYIGTEGKFSILIFGEESFRDSVIEECKTVVAQRLPGEGYEEELFEWLNNSSSLFCTVEFKNDMGNYSYY